MKQVIIENPMINSAFSEPKRHFRFDDDGITSDLVESRRISHYFIPMEGKSMTIYLKHKLHQVISLSLVLLTVFSIISSSFILNPSPSYAFNRKDIMRVLNGDRNLLGADLSGANLSGANLYGAKLLQANLSGANLSGADLYGAKLNGAKLNGAKLSGAHLIGADLSGIAPFQTDLSGADLSGAYLNDSDFRGAIADSQTKFPASFDAKGAGVIFK